MQDRFAMPPLKPSRLPKNTRDLLTLILLAEFDSLNAALDHYAPPGKPSPSSPKPPPFKISHSIAPLFNGLLPITGCS